VPRTGRDDLLRNLNVFDKDSVILCAQPGGRPSNGGQLRRVNPPKDRPSKRSKAKNLIEFMIDANLSVFKNRVNHNLYSE
jgi:hypothetical protein